MSMGQLNELYKLTERKALANMDFSLRPLEIKELFECGLARAVVHLVSAPVGSGLELVLLIVSQSRHLKEERRREGGSQLVSTPAFISVKSWVPCVESLMTITLCSMIYLSSQSGNRSACLSVCVCVIVNYP